MDSTFDYQNTGLIGDTKVNAAFTQLLPEVDRITAARSSHYTTDYASINLPFDQELLTTICATVKEKKALHPTALVVIGIGGSNLGTIAVLEALRGKFYNNNQETKVYFVDTVDSDNVSDIAQLVEHELETGENILINVISKSGTTTETIANFEIFLEILKSHRPYNYHQFVIATTDPDSALWKLGEKEEFTLCAIPKNVGGRYSVFSAVGLFPLYFLDIDCKQLLEGARSGFEIATSPKLIHNQAALSATLIATHYNTGRFIHDTFLFSSALASFGAWYRQLSAESLGKSLNKHNNLVNIGLLSTISMGSTDLHSVVQLYLGGPDNRFTTFIDIARNETDLVLPHYPEYESLVENIQNKSLITIMNAILAGTKATYLKDNRPFASYTFPKKSAFYVGQFMQIKMIEIMYVGYLLDINPFDQPEVEKYKTETRKMLKGQFYKK
jgi:glucose-6-phosphate isomerase